MSGLAEVLAEHRSYTFEVVGNSGWYCRCGQQIAGNVPWSEHFHIDHVAAAVTAWLTERLASDEVREVVRIWVCSAMGEPSSANEAHSRDREMNIATAALTAVTEALREGA